MLTPRFFHTISFPWILCSSDGRIIDQKDGLLFKLNDNAKNKASINYCTSAPPGWSKCPSGFAIYVRIIPDLHNAKLILHGLKVSGISTATGRVETLSIKTKMEDVEKYISSIFVSFSSINDDVRSLMARSVHEVRGINRDIKSAASDLNYRISDQYMNMAEAREIIKNIQALSEILSSRIDFLDYFANPALALAEDAAIKVHNKFFKTVQSLSRRANAKNVKLLMTGNSDGYIRGLRVFEVVPFILLENAIKYSPIGKDVTILFSESVGEIEVTVGNIGPKIDDDETDNVFDIGTRGRNAIAAGLSGFGIGLHFVRELVDRYHDGTISIHQSGDAEIIRNVPYIKTHVTMKLKRSDVNGRP
ncbi:sensor histidine kinase [Paramagnetospirillum caucaseum]|uniref:sensor histidine kinase n=1 Tax=Paramagnetospirillum caucaseum TaxID=1244869 RepID=UPI0009D9871E|nr:HAMP domain-containing sensor histidine kinase [Paramagnetospirillum caucaseum]